MIDPPLDLHSPGKAGKESSWWMLMKAMLLTDICDVNTISEPLRAVELPVPVPADDKILINAIRKEDTDQHYLLKLKYSRHLWMEKEIKSVANVARSDVRDSLALAAEIPIVPEVQEFELAAANKALKQLTQVRIKGAKVTRVGT